MDGGKKTSFSAGEMKKSDVFHLLPSTPDTHTHSTLHFPGKGRKKLRKKTSLFASVGVEMRNPLVEVTTSSSPLIDACMWEIESPNGLWA